MTSVWNVCWNDFFLCDYVSMSHGKEKKCHSHRSSSSSSWKWWIEERDFDRRRWQIEFFCHCQRAFWIFFSIFTMLVVFFLWHAARHIVVYQSIFVWILIGCDTPFSCQRQRHCCFFFSTPLFFSFLFVIVEVPVHFISNRTATSAVKSTALSTRSLESLVHSTQKKERQRSFLPEETSVEGIEQLPLSLSLLFFLAVVLHATHWLYECFFSWPISKLRTLLSRCVLLSTIRAFLLVLTRTYTHT